MKQSHNHGVHIVMLGMQGSGKGTIGALIGKYFKLPLVVTGDLLRDEIRRKTKIGKIAEPIVTHGDLVPSNLTKDLMARELNKKKYANGAVIDGYSRNLQQAKDLEGMAHIEWAVLLTISEKETISRISSRRSCPRGHIYNLKSRRPKKGGICDIDGLELFIREDDKPEAIRNRLRIFRTKTKPVIDYYRRHKKLIEINAQAPVDVVMKRAEKVLKPLVAKWKKEQIEM